MNGSSIRDLEITTLRLDPAEAEVRVTLTPDDLIGGLELTGRFVGPRCRYTTTVEVAYPLRSLPRQPENPRPVTARVVIPEPCLWDPETPFLYECLVQVRAGRRVLSETHVRHGLRRLKLGPKGIRLNGRRLALRGVLRGECSGEEARRLHDAGYNAILAQEVTDDALWDTADRYGLLVICCITHPEQLARAAALGQHPCCLGWLVPESENHEELLIAALSLADSGKGHYVGIELDFTPEVPLPQGISFVVCRAEFVEAVAPLGLPRLALVGEEPTASEHARGAEPGATLGWIVG